MPVVSVADVIERIYESRLPDDAFVVVYVPQRLRNDDDYGAKWPAHIIASRWFREPSHVTVRLSDEFPLGDPYSVPELRQIIDDAELPGDAEFRITLDDSMLDNREPPGGWYVT